MAPTYKPAGYASVSAYVMADGAQRVIAVAREAFGAEDLRRRDGPDGRIRHAELRIDDTVVMLADGGGDFPAFPVWLRVYVPDVDTCLT